MLSKGFRIFKNSLSVRPIDHFEPIRTIAIHNRNYATELSKFTDRKVKLSKETDTSQFVFVGGKGGVGKTSSSSAIALASSDNGYKTLVVSTDPAHSLGDALDINLRSGDIVRLPTENNLWALEIDVERALDDFRKIMDDFDAQNLSSSLGIPKEIIDSLGIEDFTSIFTNPPPGIDEIVALISIFKYADQVQGQSGQRFDRIVVDTAPTGHTIRLLQLPTFLNTFIAKLIKVRTKITSAIDTFKNLFGGENQNNNSNKIETVLNKLDNLQRDVNRLSNALKDSKQTQFVVVTIPTQLAVAESRRLVESLQNEGIKVSTIICNQILAEGADIKYLSNRSAGQQACISMIKSYLQNQSLQSKGSRPVIEVTEVPYVETEVTGIYGLKYFKNVAHPPIPRTATNPIDSRELTIFGGKGGVGKTTSAASWAVQLSDSGFRTLVVSTDPAHSLGDAIQEKLSGVPKLIDQSIASDGGQLWAMEIDPTAALEEFQEILQSATGGTNPEFAAGAGGGGMLNAMGLGDIKKELFSMMDGTKDPPPGTDEVVALTKIIKYLDDGYVNPIDGSKIRFDRIVIDTAPTGHTLRMLQLPIFLQELMDKMVKIRDKTNSMSNMMGMMDNEGSGVTPPVDRLKNFKEKMNRLEALLHSPKDCEFTVVTIPTQVALAETQRLIDTLQQTNILVRRLIINQIIPKVDINFIESMNSAEKNDDTRRLQSYLNNLRTGQAKAIYDLEQLSSTASAPLIKIPYFDMEVKTVYGLRALTNIIFPAKN